MTWLVPFSYGEKERPKLRKAIQEKVHALDSRFQCVITFDNAFMGGDLKNGKMKK